MIDSLLKKFNEIDKRFNGTLRQFIRFGAVGVSNTAVGYILNIATLLILRPLDLKGDYFIANIVAFVLGVLWVYYWSNRFVFKQKEGDEKRVWWKVLLKVYITYGISGFIIANILSWIWIENLGISKFVAPLLNLIVTVPFNFILNKFWAYKDE